MPGETALMRASVTGEEACVGLLLGAHASVDQQNSDGDTALM
jgi:ankyrin repeat protein